MLRQAKQPTRRSTALGILDRSPVVHELSTWQSCMPCCLAAYLSLLHCRVGPHFSSSPLSRPFLPVTSSIVDLVS
ncbi:hypothetical protein ACCO45_007106 [Purpureocillium lilacinum]|uniref:Uncharacterized protein n=1 Tax=Purpureocillium lilacinum TaxID=33203 RepID=A0ACC4DST3_PURLI